MPHLEVPVYSRIYKAKNAKILLPLSTDDPAIFIAEETLYAARGSTKQITAIVYSSGGSASQVDWYFQGMRLDPTSNPRYSVEENEDVHSLSVMNVDSDVLGQYSAVVTANGRNATDTVQLSLPGM